ncbi:MAG: F0F1 ATP synthase subunit B [Acidimicrobiia bacterium]|nr:MAG: F0F1 ATP synthase subunit B [Acidimicrobiia bacterium]
MYVLLTNAYFLLQEVEPISEEVTEESGAGLLLPATEELIAGIIAFSIVFFFVWKWGIPALNTALEARQQAINTQLEAAEAAKVEAESLLTDYERQIANAKAEAGQIVEDARGAADEVKTGIVERAEAEAEQIKERAKDELSADRERVAGELRRQVADLSIDVAERVVGLSLDDDSQRELVDRYIEELGGVS